MQKLIPVTLSILLLGCSDGTSSDPDGATDAAAEPDATADAADDPVEDVEDDAPAREIRWITIPLNPYEMGCSPGDTECYDAELPVHTVTFAYGFEITETEITQHQYTAEIGDSPFYFSGCDNCPADSITWNEAHAFCEAIGARLPTEAEWEYAARGGTTTRYPCGDDASCLDAIAWYGDNSGAATHIVAQKDANGFGLYDMLGNVWEWTEDCWHDDYTSAPADGSAWVEDGCTYRIVRGGCFGLGSRGLRVSNRDGDYPDSYLLPTPGFRCARDL